MKISPLTLIIPTALITALAWFGINSMEPELDKIHGEIEASFDLVEHINADEFLALDPSQIVVFDVREPDEYAVSHLATAVQLDPNIDADTFFDEYNSLLPGKIAVFYCSVGWRSSELAQRVDEVLTNEGVAGSYNLAGGLFKWHNEARPLMSPTKAATNSIHPYDSFWGKLIEDQTSIDYGHEKVQDGVRDTM